MGGLSFPAGLGMGEKVMLTDSELETLRSACAASSISQEVFDMGHAHCFAGEWHPYGVPVSHAVKITGYFRGMTPDLTVLIRALMFISPEELFWKSGYKEARERFRYSRIYKRLGRDLTIKERYRLGFWQSFWTEYAD